MVVAANASADPVIFRTEFDFNPATAAIDSTLYLADSASLTLTGNNVVGADTPEFDVIFGAVSFDPKDSRGTLSVDQDFILKVTLIDPSAGASGGTTANFWGSVNTRSATGTISLTGGSVLLGGFKFTLQDTDVSLLSGSFASQNLLGSVESFGSATAVPVPAAVWGGVGLLGLLGGGRVWKRRRDLA